MKENHEKTGLAAFILALAGVLSLGLAVVPAVICAWISKRQSEAAGKPTDGFATAAMVLSGFILAVWAVVILGGGAVMMGNNMKAELPNISVETMRSMLVATGFAIVSVAIVMWMSGRSKRRAENRRLRRLAGRGLGSHH